MFPIIDLPINTICPPVENFLTGKSGRVGKSFAYQWNVLEEVAEQIGDNLDGLLTRFAAAGIYEKPLKSPSIFWYTPFNELVVLTACCTYKQASFSWLRGIPGYLESSQDFVPESARPVLYWDGNMLYRTYWKSPDLDHTKPCVCDWGSLFGMLICETDSQTYRRIQKNPAGNFDYSVVPNEPTKLIEHAGKEYTIHHTYFRLPGQRET